MPDVHMRLVLYKRIASAQDHAELQNIQTELIDRFGLLPEATKNLIMSTELKLFAKGLGIIKLEAHEEGGRIIFGSDPKINVDRLLTMIQLESTVFKMNGSEKLGFNVHLPELAQRSEYLKNIINTIANKP